MSTQEERDRVLADAIGRLFWPADAPRLLRAVADSWAPDGEYTADDLRALADQFDPPDGQ